MIQQRVSVETRSDIYALIVRDLHRATDDRDLARRLARHGLGYRDTNGGRKLVTLPHGIEVMDLA